jgi:hypothetical protein
VLTSRKVITDGPFAEGKEVVGGYFLVRAETLEQAAEMAKDCPIFESGGSVEVRLVQVVNPISGPDAGIDAIHRIHGLETLEDYHLLHATIRGVSSSSGPDQRSLRMFS